LRLRSNWARCFADKKKADHDDPAFFFQALSCGFLELHASCHKQLARVALETNASTIIGRNKAAALAEVATIAADLLTNGLKR
jgi:hypothetical protein